MKKLWMVLIEGDKYVEKKLTTKSQLLGVFAKRKIAQEFSKSVDRFLDKDFSWTVIHPCVDVVMKGKKCTSGM